MRNKVAKAIRRRVYGDYSIRQKSYFEDRNQAIRCLGKRAEYQIEKRRYKAAR